MASEEIPPDILKAARKAADSFVPLAIKIRTGKVSTLEGVIARALLAERQRCARLLLGIRTAIEKGEQ